MQMAFIAYNLFDRPIDTAAVSPVHNGTQMPANLTTTDDGIVVIRSGETFEKDRRPEKAPASITVAKNSLKPLAKPISLRPQTAYAAKSTSMRPAYRIAPVEYRAPSNALAASVLTKEPRRRSFISRAQPVIKKPYDWAKAIAGIFK